MSLPSGPRVRYGTRPGPQSTRGTRPIDTAPTAAVPIMVRMTRRERFMGITCSCTCEEFWESQALIFKPRYSSSGIEAELRLTGKPKRTVSQDRAGRHRLVSSSAAAGKMRRERMRKPAESAARDAARSGIGCGACRRMAGRGVSAEKTAARRSARRAVTATGRRSAGWAFGIGLRPRRRCHSRSALFAVLAWHQRVGATANGKGAHQQQRHMVGALHRYGGLDRNRLASAEFPVWFLGHDQ